MSLLNKSIYFFFKNDNTFFFFTFLNPKLLNKMYVVIASSFIHTCHFYDPLIRKKRRTKLNIMKILQRITYNYINHSVCLCVLPSLHFWYIGTKMGLQSVVSC